MRGLCSACSNSKITVCLLGDVTYMNRLITWLRSQTNWSRYYVTCTVTVLAHLWHPVKVRFINVLNNNSNITLTFLCYQVTTSLTVCVRGLNGWEGWSEPDTLWAHIRVLEKTPRKSHSTLLKNTTVMTWLPVTWGCLSQEMLIELISLESVGFVSK